MIGAHGDVDTARLGRFPATDGFDEDVYRNVMSAHHLPPAPELTTATLTYLEQEDCCVDTLAAFLASDQATAAHLLRFANSATFGGRQRASTVPQAVTRVGLARVRNLILGLSVWHSLRSPSESVPRYDLWKHSVLVSGTAQFLARRAHCNPAAAFTGGLLHDIGKLVLGMRFGQTYWDLLAGADDEESLVGIENERFGCNHATVGGWLLRLWHLPTELVEMAALHHRHGLPHHAPTGADVVGIADALVDATESCSGRVDEALREDVPRLAQGLLAAGEWADLCADILGDQESIGSLFD